MTAPQLQPEKQPEQNPEPEAPVRATRAELVRVAVGLFLFTVLYLASVYYGLGIGGGQ